MASSSTDNITICTPVAIRLVAGRYVLRLCHVMYHVLSLGFKGARVRQGMMSVAAHRLTVDD